MKKITKILMLFSAMVLFTVANSNAQIVVRIRPVHRGPIIERPMRPSPNHVWIDAEWVPSGGTYVEEPGRWVVPPRPGMVYYPGRWKNSRGGSVWVHGHWR